MKNLSIFNVYVEMESQEQCDRMKQLCVDNGLINDEIDTYFEFYENYKYLVPTANSFYISSTNWNHSKVTETEFIELLKQYKNE